MAGSVVMAFEEVCPDRIDLIHKNYRKLCNLLVDVEEWGQVVIISMLTRYARTQFLSPWKEVRRSLSGPQPERGTHIETSVLELSIGAWTELIHTVGTHRAQWL